MLVIDAGHLFSPAMGGCVAYRFTQGRPKTRGNQTPHCAHVHVGDTLTQDLGTSHQMAPDYRKVARCRKYQAPAPSL
jgi:hypothetical protein